MGRAFPASVMQLVTLRCRGSGANANHQQSSPRNQDWSMLGAGRPGPSSVIRFLLSVQTLLNGDLERIRTRRNV
jgi:hypothetical protein